MSGSDDLDQGDRGAVEVDERDPFPINRFVMELGDVFFWVNLVMRTPKEVYATLNKTVRRIGRSGSLWGDRVEIMLTVELADFSDFAPECQAEDTVLNSFFGD